MRVFRFAIVPAAGCIAFALACRPAIAGDTPAWNWRLAGVIVGQGVDRALFARNSETQSVARGGQIDGWTVAAVRPDGVTLVGPDGEKRLRPEASDAAGAVRLAPTPVPVPTVAAAARAQQQAEAAADAVLTAATKQMMRNHP